jgi:hypothetical protein
VTDTPRLWHVTVTVGGDPHAAVSTRAALSRLQQERPFLDSVRYDERKAELAYWEEGATMVDAASLALRLWDEHRATAGLPPWKVLGLEVLERDVYLGRQPATPLASVDASPRHF